jgi:protein-tyrosine phosphatase
MTPKLYWIDSKGPGRMAISARPRGGDWLEDEIAGWRSQGIDAVISMLTSAEEEDLHLAAESSLAREEKIRFISLPVEDRGVPPSWKPAAEVIHQATDILRRGQNIAIHCRQGIGRSGIIAAAMLILEGATPQEALKRVSTARGLPVPETAEQKDWVKRFAERESTARDSDVKVPAR